MRSTGGEQIDLGAFEGLVRTTARMFASQVKREEDDLAQELRVRVWRALVSYDPDKSRLSRERYVFQAVTNKIKDYKRDAAREVRRRDDAGLTFLYIEDTFTDGTTETATERFASLYYHTTRDEVYGEIEEGRFVLPATITERETFVLLMLMMQHSKTEIVVRLGLTREEVDDVIVSLRDKLRDWQPNGTERGDACPGIAAEPPPDGTVRTVRAESRLVGSRAA